MNFDRAEIKGAFERIKAKATAEGARQQRAQQGGGLDVAMLRQEAVNARYLMADPVWAVHQQRLQYAVEELVKERDKLMTRLAQPMPAEATDALRCQIAKMEGSILGFVTAIALPKQISEAADGELAARTIVDEFLQNARQETAHE